MPTFVDSSPHIQSASLQRYGRHRYDISGPLLPDKIHVCCLSLIVFEGAGLGGSRMKPAWASSEKGEDGACWTVGVECGGRPLTLNDLADDKETPGTETSERILRGQVCVSSVYGATHSADTILSPQIGHWVCSKTRVETTRRG
ncbi:hypothetical protein MHYP_G00239410 [Metynnis hypsauchen]